MARGIERRSIFITERDRLDFLDRLDRLVEAGALRLFAFALMPNHFHILARTGSQPISRAMSSLLTGYAVSFNHRRAGIVASVDELDHDPTTGHASIIGTQAARFLDVDHVLSAFGSDRDSARLASRAFVVEGLDEKAMREMTRRGKVWREIAKLAERTRREKAQGRILGSNAFLDNIRAHELSPFLR